VNRFFNHPLAGETSLLREVQYLAFGMLMAVSLKVVGAAPGSSQSVHYQADYQAMEASGGHSSSISYSFESSGGEISGPTTSTDGLYTNRPGYVGQVNDPPLLSGLSLDRASGSGVKFVAGKLAALAANPEGDAYSLIAVGPVSANGAIIAQDGPWIIYLPPSGFNGTDTFSYIMGDSLGNESSASVTVFVLPADNGPTKNIVSITTKGDGSVQILFNGIPNRTYLVQAATTLATPTWTSLGSVVASDSGAFAFDDTDAVHFSGRYYRAVSP
jgi:Bacterial Ig domain